MEKARATIAKVSAAAHPLTEDVAFIPKLVFGLHLIFIGWASQNVSYHLPWSPDGYRLYNALFLLQLLWAIHTRDRTKEHMNMAILINIICIPLDIAMISVNWKDGTFAALFQMICIIVNLVLRPFTSHALYGYTTRLPPASSSEEFGIPHTKEPQGVASDHHGHSMPAPAPGSPPPYQAARWI